MKRILVFAVLAGALAAAATTARAQGGPMGGAQAPQQNGQAPADTNVVQPEASRGALGGLASGAPGVAENVQQLGKGAAAPVVGESKTVVTGGAAVGGAVSGGAVAGGAVAGGTVAGGTIASGSTTVVSGTTTVVATQQQQLLSRAQRHWLVARTMQHCMFFSDVQPHVIRRGDFFPIGFPGGPFIAPPIGDLELVSVGMVADGVAEKGPIYRISVKNNSTIAARHFRVSLIATLGELTHLSPVVTMNIDELAAGAVGHIDVQLPHGVMTLGPQGQPGPFTTLIAAIDSFDELIESDELNNVATFTRGEIALIETVQETATTTAAPAVAGAAPAAAPAQAPAAGGQAAPAAPAPQDNGELNKLDLDNVNGASELLSK
jgi:hypothetical protein